MQYPFTLLLTVSRKFSSPRGMWIGLGQTDLYLKTCEALFSGIKLFRICQIQIIKPQMKRKLSSFSVYFNDPRIYGGQELFCFFKRKNNRSFSSSYLFSGVIFVLITSSAVKILQPSVAFNFQGLRDWSMSHKNTNIGLNTCVFYVSCQDIE